MFYLLVMISFASLSPVSLNSLNKRAVNHGHIQTPSISHSPSIRYHIGGYRYYTNLIIMGKEGPTISGLSWLFGCKQQCVSDNQASDPVLVLIDVLRGLVLRPILFLIFINEYRKCSKISNTFLFLFSIKMLILKAGIHKMLVRIANREDPDLTASSVCLDLFGR